MNILALIIFAVAFVLALSQPRVPWWLCPAFIALGVAVALVVTTGTQVSVH